MSSPGQIIGGVVGAVAGFFVGGPSGAIYGAQLGMMAGGAIDPPKGPSITGPRLDDLSVQTATYGAPLPRGYGTVCVTGNIFWLEGDQIKEWTTTEEQGGKGGGGGQETTEYHYSATFGVGLMHVPAGATVSLRRLWIDTDLVYEAGSDNIESIIASQQAVESATSMAGWIGAFGDLTVTMFEAFLPKFAFYDGSDDQLPNARMQADKGAANVSAYPGLCYVIFEDLSLEKYSNTLMRAQVKCELVINAVETRVASQSVSVDYALDAGRTNAQVFTAFDGEYVHAVYCEEDTFDSANPEVVYVKKHIGGDDGIGWRVPVYAGGGAYATHFPEVDQSDTLSALITSHVATGYFQDRAYLVSNGAIVWDTGWLDDPAIDTVLDRCVINGGVAWAASSAFSKPIHRITEDGATKSSVNYRVHCLAMLDGYLYAVDSSSSASSLVILKIDSAALTTVSTTTLSGIDGRWARLVMIAEDEYYVWRSRKFIYHIASGSLVDTIADPFGISSSTDASNDLTWFGGGGDFWWGLESYNTSVDKILLLSHVQVPASSSPLRDIVTAECSQAGITASDIDLNELTNSDVRGFRVAQRGAVRNALEPLQAAYPFDLAQSGYKIRFVTRGGASVASIPSDDLGATDGEVGVLLPVSREMDSQLPFRVSVRYSDHEREYDIGEQSVTRDEKDSLNERVMELPLSLTSAEAIKMADVLLAKDWTERIDFGPFTLPPSWRHLEAADVVTISHRGKDHTMRLTRVEYLPDGRVVCQSRLSAAQSYTSSATTQSPLVPGQSLVPLKGLTDGYLLDIPRIRSEQDVPGMSYGLAGLASGWPGATLVRSDDQGNSYQAVGAVNARIKVFIAADALSSHHGYSIDHGSVLTVTPRYSYHALASVTEDQLYAHSNLAAYGGDGRWEIIAFRTVSDNTGSYIVKDFLRGLYGTEWATGLHAAGDYLIMLDTSTVSFFGLPTNAVGSTRLYRAITQGSVIESASDIVDIYDGNNLKPLSPVDLCGDRNALTNDWTLSVKRRSRWPVELFSGYEVPLGEAVQSYDLLIYNSDYSILKRTFSGLSDSSTNYTSAQQVEDFGINQNTLYVEWYMNSVTVGRGNTYRSSIYRPLPSSSDFIVAGFHFDGANGSTSITEVTGRTVSVYGNAALSTARFKWNSSLLLDGTGDYISIPHDVDLDLTAGDWTIRGWIWINALSGGGMEIINKDGVSGSSYSQYSVYINGSGKLCAFLGNGNGTSPTGTTFTGTSTLSTGAWQYIEVNNSGGTIRGFAGGTLEFTGAKPPMFDGGKPVLLGYQTGQPTSAYFNGNLEDFSILKGLAEHTASYSIPSTPF